MFAFKHSAAMPSVSRFDCLFSHVNHRQVGHRINGGSRLGLYSSAIPNNTPETHVGPNCKLGLAHPVTVHLSPLGRFRAAGSRASRPGPSRPGRSGGPVLSSPGSPPMERRAARAPETTCHGRTASSSPQSSSSVAGSRCTSLWGSRARTPVLE